MCFFHENNKGSKPRELIRWTFFNPSKILFRGSQQGINEFSKIIYDGLFKNPFEEEIT